LRDFLPSKFTDSYTSDVEEIAGRFAMTRDEVLGRLQELTDGDCPILELKGCRMSIIMPEITRLQIKAILGAACIAQHEGIIIRPDLLVPSVCAANEMEIIVPIIRETAEEVFKTAGCRLQYQIGCYLETPRALLRANTIASVKGIDFLTIGTDDLTKMMFGFTRDESSKFVKVYMDKGIFSSDPFSSIDEKSMGTLIHAAVNKCRQANQFLTIGISGEHGGDAGSVQYYDSLDIDFITCAPESIPAAKVAAAQSRIRSTLKPPGKEEDMLLRSEFTV